MINTTFCFCCRILLFVLLLGCCCCCSAQSKDGKWTIRVMEYNVENLFDCSHDSLKNDYDYLPEGAYAWTRSKYWRKLNAVARGIVLASTEDGSFLPPDLIGLCEVENDSVLHSLTHRSLLRGAGYEYLMTSSPDARGVDVALLYQPVSFRPVAHHSLRIDTIPGMHQTRDILYVKGEIRVSHDAAALPATAANAADAHSAIATVPLHVFVLHAPSRRGGERETRPYRKVVTERLLCSVDSIRGEEHYARIIVMGDFNDYTGDASMDILVGQRLVDVTSAPYITPDSKVKGTYRYQGEWGSLDHVFVSDSVLDAFVSSRIGCHPDLLESDDKYGGVKPYRFFRGPTMHGGYSDHLPLLVNLAF